MGRSDQKHGLVPKRTAYHKTGEKQVSRGHGTSRERVKKRGAVSGEKEGLVEDS